MPNQPDRCPLCRNCLQATGVQCRQCGLKADLWQRVADLVTIEAAVLRLGEACITYDEERRSNEREHEYHEASLAIEVLATRLARERAAATPASRDAAGGEA